MAQPLSFVAPGPARPRRIRKFCGKCAVRSQSAPLSATSVFDIVVVGAGLGGLSAAALLSASYGRSVCVLEAHSVPGGAAHEFSRRTPRGVFKFDVGPHLFSGLSSSGAATSSLNPGMAKYQGAAISANPMQHVLRAVGAELPVVPYKRWGVLLPNDVYIPTTVSPSQPLFSALIGEVSGKKAQEEVANLLEAMVPLCKAATALPPAALRAGDLFGSLKVARRFLARPDLLFTLPHLSSLTSPFAPILDKHVSDPFARNFLDLLCFLLAGVPADKIPTAEVAFMFSEWTGATAGSSASDSVLEHPVGGAAGIVSALVGAVERRAESRVRTSAKVKRIILEEKEQSSGSPPQRRAVGVQLQSGEEVYAREAVISNLSSWDLPSLFSNEDRPAAAKLPQPPAKCPSFMHLHLAIELTPEVMSKLPHALEVNYASVEDWDRGVDADGNVVLISIPTVAEPDRAPNGFAVVHAYTPATEPYDVWSSVEYGSDAYGKLKEERAQVLWRALARIFGQDVRALAHISMVGTPLTHESYLNRKFGTYGPEVDANDAFFALPFPQRKEVAEGLWCVGDSTFPGIGVPATAASGWLAANAIADVDSHAALLRKIGL